MSQLIILEKYSKMNALIYRFILFMNFDNDVCRGFRPSNISTAPIVCIYIFAIKWIKSPESPTHKHEKLLLGTV